MPADRNTPQSCGKTDCRDESGQDTPTNRGGQRRVLAGGRKNGLIFLEGAQFAACLFLCVSKNTPYKISVWNIRTAYRPVVSYCQYAVSLFCYIDLSVSRLFPLPSASLYRRERGKIFGLNTLCPQRKILPETASPPDLFTFRKVCTNFYGRARKQAATKLSLVAITGMCAVLTSLFHQFVHFL